MIGEYFGELCFDFPHSFPPKIESKPKRLSVKIENNLKDEDAIIIRHDLCGESPSEGSSVRTEEEEEEKEERHTSVQIGDDWSQEMPVERVQPADAHLMPRVVVHQCLAAGSESFSTYLKGFPAASRQA